jgi:NADPH-dependent 2,4-dienoyl-CoA reductase/sulfur reductase-like enzyme
VGDVARWHNPLFGRDMRIEHLTNAREQAAAVARNLIGTHPRTPYAPVPYFWSDQFGSKLQFFGHADPTDTVHVVFGEPDDGGPFVALFERDGRLVGAFGVDAARRLIGYRPLIAASTSIAEGLEPAPV